MDYYMIGQRIRKHRKARGLSQEQLAEKVGISVPHMSHIETGNTKLSLPVLVDIAQTLEVRTDELLSENIELVRDCTRDDLLQFLDNCSTQELCIITDIIKATRTTLRKYSDNK